MPHRPSGCNAAVARSDGGMEKAERHPDNERLTAANDMTVFVAAGDTGMPYLYHYQRFNVDHLRTVIVDKRLHFARPSTFNDPWDCKPCFNIDLSDEASVAGHIEYFQRVD